MVDNWGSLTREAMRVFGISSYLVSKVEAIIFLLWVLSLDTVSNSQESAVIGMPESSTLEPRACRYSFAAGLRNYHNM
ncbi:hypothetical protein TMatcc_010068 [Talaromyces marneffei ATCC 18224]